MKTLEEHFIHLSIKCSNQVKLITIGGTKQLYKMQNPGKTFLYQRTPKFLYEMDQALRCSEKIAQMTTTNYPRRLYIVFFDLHMFKHIFMMFIDVPTFLEHLARSSNLAVA